MWKSEVQNTTWWIFERSAVLKTVWKSEFQNTSKSLRELVENSDLWRFPLACGRGLWPWIKWMGLWPSSRSEIKWMGLWPSSRSRTRNNDDSAAPHGFSPALPRRSAAGSESSPGTIFQAASSLEDASPARPGIVASRRLIMASRRWSSHGTSR